MNPELCICLVSTKLDLHRQGVEAQTLANFALATKSELEIVPVIHPEAQTLNINPRKLGVGLRQGPEGLNFLVREVTLQGGSWLDRVLHLDPRPSPPCVVWGVEIRIWSFG